MQVNNFFKNILILLVFVSIVGTTLSPNFVYATHSVEQSGGEPPINKENDPCTAILDNRITVPPRPPTPPYVPVRDSANLDRLGDVYNQVQDSRLYLQLLCEKEYEEDHTLQHRWRTIIGLLINDMMFHVNNFYNGNPLYVLNPYVYYRNIETLALVAFYNETLLLMQPGSCGTTTCIDPIEGTSALRKLLEQSVDTYAGNNTVFVDWTNFNPQDKLDFETNTTFNYDAFYNATQDALNKPGYVTTAILNEYEERKHQIRAVEEQKLNWGRGFFPVEYCGQQVFSEDPVDIRTCITFTPAAVVQDVTTWMLTSSLRQMELADEYEEWISASALAATYSVTRDRSGLIFANIATQDVLFEGDGGAVGPGETINEVGRVISELNAQVDQALADYNLSKNLDKSSTALIIITAP